MTELSPKWGKLPAEVYTQIKKREWDHPKHLKERLLNQRQFPIEISLLPPSGNQVLDNMMHFKNFINQWDKYPQQQWINWQEKTLNKVGQQRIPTKLILKNRTELFEFLGPKVQQEVHKWEKTIQPLMIFEKRFYPVLINHLSTIQQLTVQQSTSIISILKQLYPFMGTGSYLRTLPLQGIDTKFLENNKVLISALLDVLHNGAITKAGGLLNWLGCLESTKGWLMVKPLCKKAQSALAELPILQMDQHTLMKYELPANNILVVENIQSGLALPQLPDSIAVFGGGNNVSWLSAPWLKQKKVGYWGDIDSWGLKILSQAKMHCPHIHTLMMDEETLYKYHKSMTKELESYHDLPAHLNPAEKKVFTILQSGKYDDNRLEQERLPNDYILTKLQNWLSNY